MAMLDDMGWTDSDGDGFRDRDGETLSIEIATHSEDPNRVQSVEYLQAIFESAGIDATVRITDWPSFSSGYVQQGEHQIALLGWLRITDPDRLLYGQLTTGSGLNWGGYSNAEVDALLEAGRTELDQAARAEAYQAAATIIAEELPYYIISYQGYQMFYDPEAVSDVEASPRGGFRGLIGMPD
jgi:peptide/nickel transport system substrate-binding protein